MCPVRQLGPVVRSITAATGGGVAEGLLVSLLERFIEVHQADVPRLLKIRQAPATGAWLHDSCKWSIMSNLQLRKGEEDMPCYNCRSAALASLVHRTLGPH